MGWISSELGRAVRGADDLEALNETLFTLRDELSFAHMVYHALPGPMDANQPPVLLLTYPEEWRHRYFERNYLALDPVVQAGQDAAMPFEWADLNLSSKAVRDFFEDADTYGVGRNGLSIPLRGPSGGRALMTVTSNKDSAAWDRLMWIDLKRIISIGWLIHEQAMMLARRSQGAPTPALTVRELACLDLLRLGQTPKQTAARLRISITRVNHILRRACQKLGCHTATQAVALAIRLQMLDP